MSQELHEQRVADLVRASVSVLKSFKSGHSPTFKMLDRLEGALFPFTEDNLCGHRIDEDCGCAEARNA